MGSQTEVTKSGELVSVDEATRILSYYATQRFTSHLSTRKECVSLYNDVHGVREILGRVVAEDIYSKLTSPAFDNSAMDGYAFRLEDIVFEHDADKYSLPVPVVDTIGAGMSPSPLQERSCMRIFTGAPVPEHADLVVPQELCVETDGEVTVCAPRPALRANIREKGLNFKVGDVVCKKGDVINPAMLSVLSSVGITDIQVYKKLCVGICITGDELVSPDEPLPYGKIYDSNRVFLRFICEQQMYEVVRVLRVGDNLEATRDGIYKLASQCDVLICSGGISVGERDFVKDVLLNDAQVLIRKIAVKPGKPFTFVELKTEATQSTTPIICLPGNPMAVFAGYHYFLAPFLEKLQGRHQKTVEVPRNYFSVPAPRDYPMSPRTQFFFSTLNVKTMEVCPVIEQSSAALKNMIEADGILIIPEQRLWRESSEGGIKKGEILNFLPL